MANVSFSSQSFHVDGRRLWIMAASFHYARVPTDAWAARIRAARDAGFNTIETACPWMIHEPRKGRFDFEGSSDVRRFVELCGEAQMRVILRAGPYIGAGFDGGGLPRWLDDDPKVRLREANEPFLARVSKYFRKLMAQLSDLQATDGGPLVLVQVEHRWMCANDEQADKYLREIARMIRECGVNVPLINANNLWLDSADTIDTWRGDTDLLANLRQLRLVQPGAPRIVSAVESASQPTWGQPPERVRSGDDLLRQVAAVLAAGAQPIVTPFHGGTNFAFLGGRQPGPDGGPVTTCAAAGAPLGEAGARGAAYHRLRRVVTFANHYGHVFADLDPEYQPVSIDPGAFDPSAGGGGGGGGRSATRGLTGLAAIPLRGAGGSVTFVFADSPKRKTTLLLESGIRLPVDLGDQQVGWFLVDADLHGRGNLDYANLCPFAIVDRSIAVFYGPPKSPIYLSLNGTPVEGNVPSDAKPLVLEQKGITFVILNSKQIDTTYVSDDAVYVGVGGLDADGEPLPANGTARGWRITHAGGLERLAKPEPRRSGPSRSIRLTDWHGAPGHDYAGGESPRYASLPGPQTLAACGAATGYGWYRIRLKTTSTKKRRIHFPGAGDRLQLMVNGVSQTVVGDGPGANWGPIDLSLAKGDNTIVALVDNLGRYADGNDLNREAGLWTHLYEVKPMGAVRPKQISAAPVDPFALRAFVLGQSAGQHSDTEQLEWSFTHARKTAILVEIIDARTHGTFTLNGEPLTYFAGSTGAGSQRFVLDPVTMDGFKRGKNVLRFAPDAAQPGGLAEMKQSTKLYECVSALTQSAEWAFAKWEPPAASAFKPIPAQGFKGVKRIPCWWRCSFRPVNDELPWWLDTSGLSKGQAFINGHNVGRYFTATATGKKIGPQHRLALPHQWLSQDGPNDLLLFDEHGALPNRVKIVARAEGDLDA